MKKNSFKLNLWILFAVLCGSQSCGRRFEFSESASLQTNGGPGVVTDSDSKLRMATRAYVASTLREVFGAASHSSVEKAIEELVVRQLAPFAGGPCDRYGEDCPLMNNGSGRVDPAGESQSSVIPAPTTARFALMIRVCERITSEDKAIFFAASQAMGGAVANHLPMPLEGDVTAAFDLFHTGEVPPKAVTNELLSLAKLAYQQGGTLEAWRFLLLTLCTSPGWQIP